MRAILILLLLVAVSVPALHARGASRNPPAGEARTVLRDVARAQTDYRAGHGRYTASLAELGLRRPPGVDVRIMAAGSDGYSAVAVAASEECAVFHGRARPPRSYARTAGRVACRRR